MKKKKKKKKKRKIFLVFGILLSVAVVLCLSVAAVRAIGRSNLKGKAETGNPQMLMSKEEIVLTEEEKEEWQEGWVKYKDRIYAYNEDILTFLFMGIDKDKEVTEVAEGTNGGQADALFLLVLNPHDKSIKVISINRNTMTDIDMYDEEGAYISTVTAQIAVQHGFGNGVEESCEYQVNAVQRLFYHIPIHGYCAVNMGAIISLTDLVGGIEVTALEDVRSSFDENKGSYVVRKDENVLLDGRKAYSYVRYRDVSQAGSADNRLKRQQQFLGEFIRKTKAETAGDITLPIRLYNAVTEQMVTDVTVDEVAYLAPIAVDYGFDKNQFFSLKGETVMGEQFEEYYIDEEALYEMILDIFYEPVER